MAAIVGASSIARDITDRKQFENDLLSTEEQLRQAQKMEAVGRLAGGIAHDFKNLLASINGFTELALAHADPDPMLIEYLQEAKKSGDRSAQLTLVFRTELDPGLMPIKADPGRMHQIILNLALNAREAMPNGGELIIRTFMERPDLPSPPQRPETQAKPRFVLEVADTGVGVTPEVQSRIFEPFFMTKEVGKGTCFRIVLPVAAGNAEPVADNSGQSVQAPGNKVFPVVEEKPRCANSSEPSSCRTDTRCWKRWMEPRARQSASARAASISC